MQSRDEIIIQAMFQTGNQKEKDAAWRYLRSVSAKAEADIVSTSETAQNRIILAISRTRSADLRNYHTQDLLRSVHDILGKMVGDCEALTRRLITANILAGKLRSQFSQRTKPEALITAIRITDADEGRIDRLVSENMKYFQQCASMTYSSVNSMIQRSSVRANMPDLSKTDKKAPKQEPLSREFDGLEIQGSKPASVFTTKAPTRKELEAIKSNPIVFAREAIKANVSAVKTMQSDYQKRKEEEKSIAILNKQKKTPVSETTAIARELRAQGISSFTDKAGKKWSITTYFAMAARTMSTKSDNYGEVFADEEHDLYYLVPHSKSCPLCKKYEGKVYSRSGKSKKYPALASIFKKIDPNGPDDLENTYMSIHPNCRHRFIAFKEPGAKKKPVSRPTNIGVGSSPVGAQRAQPIQAPKPIVSPKPKAPKPIPSTTKPQRKQPMMENQKKQAKAVSTSAQSNVERTANAVNQMMKQRAAKIAQAVNANSAVKVIPETKKKAERKAKK